MFVLWSVVLGLHSRPVITGTRAERESSHYRAGSAVFAWCLQTALDERLSRPLWKGDANHELRDEQKALLCVANRSIVVCEEF